MNRPSRRADARHNRERLLRAATDVFAEQGPSASLDGIARAAGIGSGTLYRHFPTREDLVRAVYRTRVDTACARGRALLAEPGADPVDSLRRWLRELVALSARNGPAGALIARAAQWPIAFAEEIHTDLSTVGDALLARARPRLRPDVTLDDLHVLVSGIADAGPADRTDRLLDVVLHGIRP